MEQKKLFQFGINAGKFKCKKLLGELSLRNHSSTLEWKKNLDLGVLGLERCLLELVWWDTFGRNSWDDTDQGMENQDHLLSETFSLEVLSR